MNFYTPRKYSLWVQILWSVFFVVVTAAVCFVSKSIIGYKIVAILLLMMVSILAMLFDIIPVLTAAVLSALVWNFFFIPPIFTFHVSDTEDLMILILYFVIASVNAVLTFKIRHEEKKSRDKVEKENAIKLYNTLLNSLSHELRTPIATIISSVDTLKDTSVNLTRENQNEVLNQIDIASIRLNRQVENLLNMSRLESEMLKLRLEWVDVEDMIFTTLEKLKPFSINHKIVYTKIGNLTICKLDEGILEQIIYNIVFNALQYTPQNSIIEIISEIKDEKFNLIIKDNGKGIDVENLNKIFEKFYRLPNSKTGGTGLGLSIVKGFVEAHNGNIYAENSEPNGLQFTIKIPVEVSYINNLKNE